MHHQSVLLKQILSSFNDKNLKVFADATLGAAGHAHAILTEHPEIERFYGFDQDPDAMKIAQDKLAPFESKLTYIKSNFCHLKEHVKQADGILADLGVSSMQLDRAEKGFSFMRDGPLDMRMSPENPLTAWHIVNEWSEKDLGRIFRDYGEEKKWYRAAGAILRARSQAPIQTTKELAAILEPVLRDWKQKIHPATKVFQAIRIATNKELEVLEQFLPQALDALKPGGILAVITFHSLEDRIVKHFFRQAASDKVSTSGIGGVFLDKKPLVRLITGKPLEAEEDEIEQNPRSRSAKLRVVEKLA